MHQLSDGGVLLGDAIEKDVLLFSSRVQFDLTLLLTVVHRRLTGGEVHLHAPHSPQCVRRRHEDALTRALDTLGKGNCL